MSRYLLIVTALGMVLAMAIGCAPEPRPRPRTFPRWEAPARAYARFEHPSCPCTFEYPAYGQVTQLQNDSCDFDIRFPTLGTTWHITNRPIRTGRSGRGTRSDVYEEYRRLLYKHVQKATAIYERPIRVEAGGGTFFEMYGQVPTSAQLFVSDSLRHAFALQCYFTTALKNDSLAPVIAYVKDDLRHLTQTLRWATPRREAGSSDIRRR